MATRKKDLIQDSTNGYVLDDKVGIGSSISTPASELHVEGATGATLTLSQAGYAKKAELRTNNVGQLIVDVNNGDVEAMRIDSTGNVGIGSSSPSGKLEVNTGSGVAYITRTAGDTGVANPVLAFGADSTSGIMAASCAKLEFRVGAVGTSAFSHGAKMSILSTGGITFNGDTATANALDDYEEGTFTPTIAGSPTYTVQVGAYTKIGNLVTVNIHIWLSDNTAGSNVTISGLPFTSSTTSNYAATGSVGGDSVGAIDGSFYCWIGSNSTSTTAYYISTTGTSTVLQTKTGSTRYYFTLTYRV